MMKSFDQSSLFDHDSEAKNVMTLDISKYVESFRNIAEINIYHNHAFRGLKFNLAKGNSVGSHT